MRNLIVKKILVKMSEENEIAEELFLREQLLQKEMALEQEQLGKAQLVKRLSEDVKEPIEQLIQFSNLALLRVKRKEYSKVSSYLAEMKLIAEDLLIYLNDLRELALLKSGKSKFNLSEIDVKSLLRSIQKKFQPIAENASVQLSFFMCAEEAYVLGDEHKLMKVMSIILAKIIQEVQDGKTIKIKVIKKDQKVDIRIIDNKSSLFDKKTLDQMYLKFEVSQNKSFFPNFNLSVCKELMLGQKGDFQIESEENGGMLFILTLLESKDF